LFRKDVSSQSSHTDYIFSSLSQGSKTTYFTPFTIFDHIILKDTINISRQHKEPAMKDFILGSDKYIICSQDMLTDLLAPFQAPIPPRSPEPEYQPKRCIEFLVWGTLEPGTAISIH
jgi:hypothetical protein